MHTLIVDDEPIARQVIREHLEDISSVKLVGEAENAYEALEILGRNQIDLLFLDIEMPKVDGLSMLHFLRSKPLTIITTAHQQFALKGYEYDIVDYLLKPISPERLFRAVNKALDLSKLQSRNTTGPLESFFIKTNNRLERIDVDEIYYVESVNNYVYLHTKNEKKLVYLTTKKIEESLSNFALMRIHKSYVVAINKIRNIDGLELRLINGVSLPISTFYLPQVMKSIRPWILKR